MSNTAATLATARNIALQTNRNASHYKPTMLVSTISNNLHSLRIGQWIVTEANQKGQYLGTTAAGTTVIRWQNRDKFSKVDARANSPLRRFAKIYGSR